MSTATLASPAIAEFFAAVRAALSDLTSDEVDDLTDGLEADLTERLEESDAAELGDPAAYAEELRTAAGLPRRPRPTAGSSVLAELRAVPARVAADAGEFVSRHPAIAGAWRFLISIRAVWWLFRAALVASAVVAVLGSSRLGGYSFAPVSGPVVVLFLVFAVVSVQFGRGRWLPFGWMRGVLLIGNVVLAIATPFVIAGVATQANNAAYASNYVDSSQDYSTSGLTLDGNQVSNIFAYDAQGDPLTDVQLFDQDGKPLNLVGDPTQAYNDDGSGTIVVPNQSVAGRLGWNVYPLSHLAESDLDADGNIDRSKTPEPATAPFGTAKPLASTDAPNTTASPGASPTASPRATPTPAP